MYNLNLSMNEPKKVVADVYQNNVKFNAATFVASEDCFQWEVSFSNILHESDIGWLGDLISFVKKHRSVRSCICKQSYKQLLSVGFKELNEQLIYYPFSVVYRVDDITDGSFYIGMCECEEEWDRGYVGSGGRWTKHIKDHPDHILRRVVLRRDFSTPEETRLFELESLKPFTYENNDGQISIDKSTGCMNTSYRTQNQPFVSKRCCDECGSVAQHTRRVVTNMNQIDVPNVES